MPFFAPLLPLLGIVLKKRLRKKKKNRFWFSLPHAGPRENEKGRKDTNWMKFN